jgi:ribonucleoside-diphosphate reductase alpha chain
LYGENPTTKEALTPEDYKGACNLGSIFLHNLIKDPFTKNAHIDIKALEDAVYTGVRFLDNIIDINKFPHITYENYQKSMRTIGLN